MMNEHFREHGQMTLCRKFSTKNWKAFYYVPTTFTVRGNTCSTVFFSPKRTIGEVLFLNQFYWRELSFHFKAGDEAGENFGKVWSENSVFRPIHCLRVGT